MVIPCPFCGSYESKLQDFGFSAVSKHDSWHVVCQGCKAQTGWHDSPKEAQRAWSRRVNHAEREVLRRLREWLGMASFGSPTDPVSKFASATLAMLDELERELLLGEEG